MFACKPPAKHSRCFLSPRTSLDAARVMGGEVGKLRQVGSHQCWAFGEGVISKVSTFRFVFQAGADF